jgi:hypothetical protein
MNLAAILLCAFTTSAGADAIVAADYTHPTERYPHGILGDKIEHAGLRVTLSDGRALSAVWSEKIVFEDTKIKAEEFVKLIPSSSFLPTMCLIV